jgi:hypothetical protein
VQTLLQVVPAIRPRPIDHETPVPISMITHPGARDVRGKKHMRQQMKVKIADRLRNHALGLMRQFITPVNREI